MNSRKAHETEATVDLDASVRVDELPFATGDRVRVLLTEKLQAGGPRHTAEQIQQSQRIRESLRGKVIRYDRPDDPVGLEDWEALGPGTGGGQ